jgi:trans-2,3-dihydro-3-hydroxyanthranilate isomerase
MKYKFYTADVFTDTRFGGNQLAVFPNAHGLTDVQMQLIAAEFNLSETTFVFPPESTDHTHRLRIFTPARELPFAGHPTIGTAFVLASAGEIKHDGNKSKLVFGEGVGPVPVSVCEKDGVPYCELTAAKLPEWGPPPPPAEHLAAMLSLSVDEVLDDADDEPQAISCGLPFLYVPVASLDAVKRARLNWEWWQRNLGSYWTQLVYLFSHETEREGSDLHARMFAMSEGYEEDPATGAAATAVAGYLARRNGSADGERSWVIEQGFELGRPSIIDVRATVKDKHVTSVNVGGNCVMISEGTMDL